MDNDSDEYEGQDYNEFSSNDDMSDSEPMMMDDRHRPRKAHARIKQHASNMATRQRNLKQKFRAFVRRFRLTDDVSIFLDIIFIVLLNDKEPINKLL